MSEWLERASAEDCMAALGHGWDVEVHAAGDDWVPVAAWAGCTLAFFQSYIDDGCNYRIRLPLSRAAVIADLKSWLNDLSKENTS